MFTAERYRAKTGEYSGLARATHGSDDLRDCEGLERSSVKRADDAQWVTETSDQMVRAKDDAVGRSKLGGKSTMPRGP